ncbi:hypothetical protein BpHYR1_043106 [Brachionus plicatilis]|uniref:Uncharacterized protein n=1 Tax=Brachionus plicatilis TaxID=10195 RepID=A0A3M7T2C3_BRAPC|nr:hypothetical protein BpHYR1_043106 [Brachionus plicatilis]
MPNTDLFLWLYQNLREFTKILVNLREFRNIYFSDLTSRHFSQLQFQLPNLSNQCCISYVLNRHNFFSIRDKLHKSVKQL